METPAPVTPTPALPAAQPATPPLPTSTPLPAPSVDRVGFPEGYRESFKLLYIYERWGNRQVRVVCGNDIAASVRPGEPFPYGSVILFESWRAKEGAAGSIEKDPNGHFVRESMSTIFVMRKEMGFGAEYGNLRNGEWEYVAYRPDKSYATRPENTASCAACHLAVGAERDWVFRADLLFAKDRIAQAATVGTDEILVDSIAFAPGNLTVRTGTRVKWTNNDVVSHTVTASDKAFDSGLRVPGTSFSFTFDSPGTFEYVCSIHPQQMRARIQVRS